MEAHRDSTAHNPKEVADRKQLVVEHTLEDRFDCEYIDRRAC